MNKEHVLEKIAGFNNKELVKELLRLTRSIKDPKEIIVATDKAKDLSKAKEYIYYENYFPNPTLSLKQTLRLR